MELPQILAMLKAYMWLTASCWAEVTAELFSG